MRRAQASRAWTATTFHKYWWEVHGPLNRDTPAVRKYFIRYEQNHRLAEDYARTDVTSKA